MKLTALVFLLILCYYVLGSVNGLITSNSSFFPQSSHATNPSPTSSINPTSATTSIVNTTIYSVTSSTFNNHTTTLPTSTQYSPTTSSFSPILPSSSPIPTKQPVSPINVELAKWCTVTALMTCFFSIIFFCGSCVIVHCIQGYRAKNKARYSRLNDSS